MADENLASGVIDLEGDGRLRRLEFLMISEQFTGLILLCAATANILMITFDMLEFNWWTSVAAPLSTLLFVRSGSLGRRAKQLRQDISSGKVNLEV